MKSYVLYCSEVSDLVVFQALVCSRFQMAGLLYSHTHEKPFALSIRPAGHGIMLGYHNSMIHEERSEVIISSVSMLLLPHSWMFPADLRTSRVSRSLCLLFFTLLQQFLRHVIWPLPLLLRMHIPYFKDVSQTQRTTVACESEDLHGTSLHSIRREN